MSNGPPNWPRIAAEEIIKENPYINTLDLVKAIREKTGCSMMEAKHEVQRFSIIDEINKIEDIEDIKRFLMSTYVNK